MARRKCIIRIWYPRYVVDGPIQDDRFTRVRLEGDFIDGVAGNSNRKSCLAFIRTTSYQHRIAGLDLVMPLETDSDLSAINRIAQTPGVFDTAIICILAVNRNIIPCHKLSPLFSDFC